MQKSPKRRTNLIPNFKTTKMHKENKKLSLKTQPKKKAARTSNHIHQPRNIKGKLSMPTKQDDKTPSES